jgi:Putative peptidoglycan binding domain
LKEKNPAAWNKLRAQEILDAQETLASFGYGTIFTATLDEKTAEALRNYQTRSGLPVTGDVDTATLRHLTEDKLELERHIPLGPAYMFNDSDWDNFLTADGAWFEQGKEPDSKTPVHPARLECFKSAGLCIIATQVSEGSEYIHLEWFGVQMWDQYEIVTQPADLPCGRETIHVSRPEKTVLTINTAAYKNVEACTKMFGPPSEASVSHLGDGSKIMHARIEAFRLASNRIKLISAEAQSRVRP